MGKGEQIKQDLEQFAHEEKNRLTGHDDKADVKEKLSHEDKAQNFTASSGITSDGAFPALTAACACALVARALNSAVISVARAHHSLSFG